jgi:radical SAM family uncharacterized protein/radical SAM-linked protein
MQPCAIQSVLAEVEKPSRYLGTEVNRVLKHPTDTDLRMVLAFPDLYEIGTSHFGIQILYHLLNRHARISVERVFEPAEDMAKVLRQKKLPLCSLETHTPLRQFHLIGFSLLYELNFTNVLDILDLAGIPVRAEQRSNDDPIVIAGGPCVSNPEPMAPFFDAMVFGDGETVLPQMADIWLTWQKCDGCNRTALLTQWARLEGVYVPGFFTAAYDADGFQHLMPEVNDNGRIKRNIVPDLDRAFFPDRPIVPFGKPVHDRLRLEISRGCSRGCRFCQAGMIYRPVRERSMRTLLDLAEKSLAATGYEDLSLLSLSTGDYSCLEPLIKTLMQRCRADRVAVSLPSIRAGRLTPELMAQIKKVRKTGFTIAPEAGSQRLRDVINKNINQNDITATVADAFAMGWQVIKLYFMIGLPTEDAADLDAIVSLLADLKRIKNPAKRRGQINVSITTFIPKAHTPFQWASQISLDEAWSKIEYLKSKLRMPGVQVKWQHPAMSLLEGAIARGDRRTADVIEAAFRLGCRFDGWNDHFKFDLWQQAFDNCHLSMDFFTARERSLKEPLPWSHMDSRLDPEFLKSQWREALCGSTLDDCHQGACHQCGVCDFDQLTPKRFGSAEPVEPKQPRAAMPIEKYRRLELIYTKHSQARFFGHLEMANIFVRALRRAGIDVLYSQGFHPMPRISFDDPLPLGMESRGERMWLRVAPPVGCQSLVEALSGHMPQGIEIIGCRNLGANNPKHTLLNDHYHILISISDEEVGKMDRFKHEAQWMYSRSRRKAIQCIDLKQYVEKFERIDSNTLELIIRRNIGCTVRPAELLCSVLEMDEQRLALVRVIKQAPVYLFRS